MVQVIPHPVLVAVGVADYRALPVLLLQAVGIELGLLLAHHRALGRALGLHQHQRLAVVAPQHVVDEALAVAVGHARDLDLEVLDRVQLPARFAQQQVDEGLAGLGLGVVVRVGDGAVRLLGRRHLFLELLQLDVQRCVAGQHFRELGVFLAQLLAELLQLLGRLGGGRTLCRLGQQLQLEGKARVRTRRAAVGAGQPKTKVEQLARR